MFVDVRASRAADTTQELEISLLKSRILTNKTWEIEAYWFWSLLWHLFCCFLHPPKWTFKLCLSSCAWTVDWEQGRHFKATRPALHLLWLGFQLYSMCWDWIDFFSPWRWNRCYLACTDNSPSWTTLFIAGSSIRELSPAAHWPAVLKWLLLTLFIWTTLWFFFFACLYYQSQRAVKTFKTFTFCSKFSFYLWG